MIAWVAMPAIADPYDSTVLLRHKDWSVKHVFDTSDGMQWCTAETAGRNGTSMSVTAYDNGAIAFSLFNPRWRMPENAERHVTVDLDYERFGGWATTYGQALSLELDGEVGLNFLTHLSMGNAAAIYNEDMRRITTFSLRGSRAAVAKLGECFGLIRLPDERDPFIGTGASGSDPFL